MYDKIELKKPGDLTITSESVIYLTEKFVDFDISKLTVDVIENVYFSVRYAFSYDNQNWSSPVDLNELDDLSEFTDMIKIDDSLDYVPDVYIGIWLDRLSISHQEGTIHVTKNVEDTINRFVFRTIKYDDEIVMFRVKSMLSIVNQFPKWNLYDNQYVNVRRWLDQCNSLAESHGLVCIYFKTDTDEVNNTLANNVTRNVVSIKKLMIQFPNGEIPNEKSVYTDWDYPMSDEIVSHIVNEKFIHAFGNKIPVSKDYLYLPLVNKLFRVSSAQPITKFMGVLGWWEVYLSKYEQDETIKMSSEIMEALSGLEDFDNIQQMIQETELFLEDTVIDENDILEETIDEKKAATQNFTNKLNDSSNYVDLKETDAQRRLYNKRLTIATINPDTTAYAVTMYDCSTVNKRTVAMTYDLVDHVSVNKKSLLMKKGLKLSFNFVLKSKISGELFDIQDNNDVALFTFELNRNKINVINHSTQETTEITYVFNLLEYYQVNIEYNIELKQLAVNIFILKDRQKKPEFQQVYIGNSAMTQKNLSEIFLYGGSFFVSEIIFSIDNEQVLSDYVNPVLNMNKFG